MHRPGRVLHRDRSSTNESRRRFFSRSATRRAPFRRVQCTGRRAAVAALEVDETTKSAPEGAPKVLEVKQKYQRMVLLSVAARTGAPALITVASSLLPCSVLPSVTRAAIPIPATKVAQ